MLYFVATPIGNLKELSFRAVEVLTNVDCIYAENPRRSLILLNEYGIKKSVLPYEKFSERQKTEEIINKLLSGSDIAVISDAGTPLISDPGGILRDGLIAKKLSFTVISGPCAAVNAVVLSGLDTRTFLTAGFLPCKKSEREKFINRFSNLEATLVFYSAVHDLETDLKFLFDNLGARKAAIVREISKKFEEVIRFNLGNPLDIQLKGEFVIVIEGADNRAKKSFTDGEVLDLIKRLMASGIDKKDAVKKAAKDCGLKKQDVYKLGFGIE